MSLQDLYYLLSIIFMGLGIIVLLVIVYFLFVLKNNINHLHNLIETKVHAFSKYTEDPTDTAIELGSKVANAAIKKVREVMKK